MKTMKKISQEIQGFGGTLRKNLQKELPKATSRRNFRWNCFKEHSEESHLNNPRRNFGRNYLPEKLPNGTNGT